jgi:hypothetical protein
VERGPRRRSAGLAFVCMVALALPGVAPLIPAPPAGAQEPPPRQEPFLCTVELNGLGQPIVDNQDMRGTPVYPEGPDGQPDRSADPIGWSEDCQAEPRVEYRYRTTTGSLQVLPDDATELPANIAFLDTSDLIGAEDMTLDGAEEIPYLIRYQRGTLPENRFIYSIAMLLPFDEVISGAGAAGDFSADHWNGRLLFSFDGGVAIGHSQGNLSTSSGTLDEAMQLGHAVLYTSGTRTATHYNLLLGGRAAVEAKQTFIADHGEPRYTVGIGGSGGGIQQYVYGQNQPDVLDAAFPLYAYPDMTTQTIHIGDCELLEHYMDVIDSENPRWSDWDQRKLVQGLNSIHGFTSSWQQRMGAEGSTECVEGWRGSTPLAANPTFGFGVGMEDVLLIPEYFQEILTKAISGQPAYPDNFPDIGRLLRQSEDPADWVEWTHFDDVREVYGTDPETGFARVPIDNIGVQYGLGAVARGDLAPEEFLDLNARVGSWKNPEDAVPESCGLVEALLGGELALFAALIGFCEGDELDAHSARQANFRLDPNDPAPRRAGDLEAIHNAYDKGLVFGGTLPRQIPVIDARHYLEHELDMHNSHQSFAARERIRQAQGHAGNHLIWWLDARPSIDGPATVELLQDGFRVMDEWMLNIESHPSDDVVASRPEAAVDTCWDTDGTLIASGEGVWSGAEELIATGAGARTDQAPDEVDGVPVGDCAAHFPIFSTSRIVAGAPISGDVYKCHTMPVSAAVSEGLYGEWVPEEAEHERLEAIFPDGVCDFGLPGVARPGVDVADAPDVQASGRAIRVSGAEPGAEVELRAGGEVVDTRAANPAGRVTFGGVAPGDYVVAQTVADQRSLLSEVVNAG